MTHPLPRQPQPQNISKRRHITMYHATPRLTVQNRWKFGDGPSFKKVSGYEGNFAIVRIGRYCEINTRTALEPPPHPLDTSKWIPLVIGSHTHIGTNCEIQAVAIGSMVWIGNGVRLGPRVIVKDNCIIEDGVHLGADTVVPPFTRITANDPLKGTELPASMAAHMQEVSLDRYHDFKLEQRDLQ